MAYSNKLQLSKEYIAGFFDGEGCIGYKFFTGKTFRRYRVGITNQNRDILVAIQKIYGGKISKKTNLKACYELWMYKKEATKFLTEIEPYLINKKYKASEFLKLVVS